TGSADFNLQLSQQRADAVRDFLVSNGIDPDRIITRGYGQGYPVASNVTAAGRQENRRVEVVVLRSGERVAERERRR
ncbi:MAG: OmpA family protein, partial [Thermodesulfobacteriota bacterium]